MVFLFSHFFPETLPCSSPEMMTSKFSGVGSLSTQSEGQSRWQRSTSEIKFTSLKCRRCAITVAISSAALSDRNGPRSLSRGSHARQLAAFQLNSLVKKHRRPLCTCIFSFKQKSASRLPKQPAASVYSIRGIFIFFWCIGLVLERIKEVESSMKCVSGPRAEWNKQMYPLILNGRMV